MRSWLILILALMTMQSCKSGKKPVPATTSKINKEYLEWDSAKINGNISMISSFRDVVNKLGKPDSVGNLAEGINGSFYHEKFQYCYFANITFEKYHDTLVFSEINLSKPTPTYLSGNQLKFDYKSTNSSFKKIFSHSYRNNRWNGTDMDKYEYLTLPASARMSDNWAFTFDLPTGKLLFISHDNIPDSAINK